MKKITLSFLIFPLILLGQVSISAKDAYEIKSYTYNVPSSTSSPVNIITVPVGESWYISSNGNNGVDESSDIFFWITSNNPTNEELNTSYGRDYFPQGMWTEGTTIEVRCQGAGQAKIDYVVYKFNNSDLTLAANFNAQPDNLRIYAYPNPTTKMLALNSENTYNITVFDLAGNKVMEVVGNTINLQQLSNATYIVKAIDSSSKEVLSYKVIKE